jgi:ketosteroid isomerase-like protein
MAIRRSAVSEGRLALGARDTDQTMPEEPTTPDPAELMQAAVEAHNARDIDAFLTFFAPDAIQDFSSVGMGIFEGHTAIRGFFEDWWGLYQEYELKLEEFRDLGSGVTIAVFSQRGRLPDSSGWVQIRHAAVSTWADGLVG